MLFEKGEAHFEISEEFIANEPWRDMAVSWIYDFEKSAWLIKLIDKRKKRVKNDVVDVEYEIVEESPKLPTVPKLITRGNLNDSDASRGSEEIID